jgi:V8-like Glu-specific endopeptidase
MSLLQRLLDHPLIGKLLLALLAVVYLVYLVAFVHVLYPSVLAPGETIIDHPTDTSADVVLQYWTSAHMSDAVDPDQGIGNASDITQPSTDISAGQAAQQDGQAPSNGESSYPLSTVGKIFFTKAGRDYVCSGTAVISLNQSVVDTAGHCLYLNKSWAQNVIFCPLYAYGKTPYGCWAARDLEVPSDWIDAKPNDLHRDLGIAIVSANSQGALTDIVGGVGWAYNQSVSQSFSAYGYPAARPFDGQTRQSCTGSSRSWKLAGGTVISIPCNMTGGSSGGPWFIQMNGNWYLDGHNDFTSSIQPGHMFSPYYDDVWYALYDKAQHS